jgi:hypothetical protein
MKSITAINSGDGVVKVSDLNPKNKFNFIIDNINR